MSNKKRKPGDRNPGEMSLSERFAHSVLDTYEIKSGLIHDRVFRLGQRLERIQEQHQAILGQRNELSRSCHESACKIQRIEKKRDEALADVNQLSNTLDRVQAVVNAECDRVNSDGGEPADPITNPGSFDSFVVDVAKALGEWSYRPKNSPVERIVELLDFGGNTPIGELPANKSQYRPLGPGEEVREGDQIKPRAEGNWHWLAAENWRTGGKQAENVIYRRPITDEWLKPVGDAGYPYPAGTVIELRGNLRNLQFVILNDTSFKWLGEFDRIVDCKPRKYAGWLSKHRIVAYRPSLLHSDVSQAEPITQAKCKGLSQKNDPAYQTPTKPLPVAQSSLSRQCPTDSDSDLNADSASSIAVGDWVTSDSFEHDALMVIDIQDDTVTLDSSPFAGWEKSSICRYLCSIEKVTFRQFKDADDYYVNGIKKGLIALQRFDGGFWWPSAVPDEGLVVVGDEQQLVPWDEVLEHKRYAPGESYHGLPAGVMEKVE